MIWIVQGIRDFGLSFVVAVGFAVLFSTPKRALLMAGMLGGIGHSLRFFLHGSFGVPLVPATLAGALVIGFAGIYGAHRTHTPPVVFTMPACITMIPGLYGYRTMLGCIKLTEPDFSKLEPGHLLETVHAFVMTSSLLFTLAIGICSGALFFRKKSAKHLFRR
ncbi:MAG: threonine/serine exporter family protein [Luteolibacter sp.]